jgi:hypothetical protein
LALAAVHAMMVQHTFEFASSHVGKQMEHDTSCVRYSGYHVARQPKDTDGGLDVRWQVAGQELV